MESSPVACFDRTGDSAWLADAAALAGSEPSGSNCRRRRQTGLQPCASLQADLQAAILQTTSSMASRDLAPRTI